MHHIVSKMNHASTVKTIFMAQISDTLPGLDHERVGDSVQISHQSKHTRDLWSESCWQYIIILYI